MSGENHLETLLASMRPTVRPGSYVFVTLPEPAPVPVLAIVVEEEGVTHVLEQWVADEQGWPYDFVAGWITLQVHSALSAVGLTAAVSTTLAEAGISCNMLAGRYHDHVLVAIDDVGRACTLLESLSERSQPVRETT